MTLTNRSAVSPSRYVTWRWLVVSYGWSGRQAYELLRALAFGASVAEARRAAERS